MMMSMSRVGRPWENAYCESFMRTLKHEEINGSTYSDLADLEQHVAEFIDRFYHPLRLHSALQYQSPEEFEQAAKEPWVPRPYLLAPLSFPRHEEIYPDA